MDDYFLKDMTVMTCYKSVSQHRMNHCRCHHYHTIILATNLQ